MSVGLFVNEVTDQYIRENFRKLVALFAKPTASFLGFKHLSLSFVQTGTNIQVPHGLGFTPQDVVVTSQIGPGSVTFNYDKFDSTHLSVTVAGGVSTSSPQTIRAYVGTHSESGL